MQNSHKYTKAAKLSTTERQYIVSRNVSKDGGAAIIEKDKSKSRNSYFDKQTHKVIASYDSNYSV